jgi:two-component system, LytTR family, response regulator
MKPGCAGRENPGFSRTGFSKIRQELYFHHETSGHWRFSSSMIRAIIVDDERPSREALHAYLRDFCPQVEIAALCDSVKSASQAIAEFKPDLIFLDIEMPNGSGFDLLRMFQPPDFKVIFVTAFSQYAINAFRYSATDYLLKPVKVDELIEAVQKAEREIMAGQQQENLLHMLREMKTNPSQPATLVVPNASGFVVVKIDEIIFCEAEGYCTRFHLEGKPVVTSSKNLKYYEEMLRERSFLRVHHSYLVNPAQVRGYSNQGEVLLNGNLKCPLGSSYKTSFLHRFAKMK